MLKKRFITLLFFLFLILIGLFIGRTYLQNNKIIYYQVKEVLDGDTILLNDGTLVRYLGIDAPEVKNANHEADCGANESSSVNRSLLENKTVSLVKDRVDKDNRGRLLRYVFTDKNEFINYLLVKGGYSQAIDIPPAGKYQELLFKTQKEAKDRNVGIWKNCIQIQMNQPIKISPYKCVSSKEAKNYIGEYTCVQFFADTSYKSDEGNIWFREKRGKSDFSVTIFPQVQFLFSADLLYHYLHKTIQVRGNLHLYQQKPAIIVNNPGQIQIVEE